MHFILLSFPTSLRYFLSLFPVGLHLLGPSPVIKTSVEQQMQRPLFFWVFSLIKVPVCLTAGPVTWASHMLLGLEGKLLTCRDSLKKKTLSCATVNLPTHLNKCRLLPCFKICIECLSQQTCTINRKLQSYGFVCFNGWVTFFKNYF